MLQPIKNVIKQVAVTNTPNIIIDYNLYEAEITRDNQGSEGGNNKQIIKLLII